MKWSNERMAASTGVGFAVLLIVAGFLPGSPMKWNASAMDVESYLQGKHKEILIGMMLSGLALVAMLWFMASFAGMFRDAGQGRLATVMYGAGVATVAIAGLGDGLQLGLTKVTETTPDANTIAALYGASTWLYSRIFWPMAALALATWLASRRSKAMPEWYSLLSLLGGGIFIISGLSLKDDGFFSVTGGMGFIGFISMSVWVAISSLLLMQRVGTEAPRAAAPAMG